MITERMELVVRIKSATIDEQLREALIAAATASEPSRSINALARHVGVSPRLLELQWAQVAAGNGNLSLKNVLSTLNLLQMLELRSRNFAWPDIVDKVSVSPRTVRRWTSRFLNRPPSTINAECCADLMAGIIADFIVAMDRRFLE